MTLQYPQFVDQCKTTIGGLRNKPHSVDNARMSESAPYAVIGQRLAAVRQAFSDLSQKDWAERHGFNQTQYNNWEKGKRRIPVDNAETLADTYGLDLDFIYRGKRDGLSETASKVL